MFDSLVGSIGGGLGAYLLIAAIAGGDAVLPVLPGETAVITGGILAERGTLSLPLVILAGAAGAFAGDNVSYWAGRSAGGALARRLVRGEAGRRRVESARRGLHRRHVTVIVTARFIPGGRTATTFAAGTLRLPWRRFAAADALGALLWSVQAALLGAIGGRAFEDSLWKPLLLALGLAALLAAIGEGLRRLRAR